MVKESVQKEESNKRHFLKKMSSASFEMIKERSHVTQDGCVAGGTQGNKMVVALLKSDEMSVAAVGARVCSCETPPVACSFILH